MSTVRSGITVGVAVSGLVLGGLLAGAGAAHADDFYYLNGLRAAGIFIHKDAEPLMAKQGHHMCNQLRNGVPPEDVANEFPALDPAVFLSILQSNLCPDTLH